MAGGAGKVAAVAAPIALGMMFPGVGTALAGGLADLGMSSALAGTLAPALMGAGTGAIGSAMTGQNPLMGAALGGIGGGIGGVTGLINTAPAAGLVGPQAAGAVAANAANGITDVAEKALLNNAAQAASAPLIGGGIASTGGGLISKDLLLPALAGGATLFSSSGNKNTASSAKKYDDTAHNVKPLQRQVITPDPSAYYGVGGNRSSFINDNPAIEYYADGGQVGGGLSVRDVMRNAAAKVAARPMVANTNTSSVDPNSFFTSGGNRNFFPNRQINMPQPVQAQQASPVTISDIIRNKGGMGRFVLSDGRTVNAPEGYMGKNDIGAVYNPNSPRGYAKGGLLVKGKGNGTSDDVPAMLSTGEYVMPAAVVSALGNGDNDAGARKLDTMKNGVLAKHYKNGKAPKSLGIGAYMNRKTA